MQYYGPGEYLNLENLTRDSVSFVKNMNDSLGREGAILGFSGGLDSAVVLKLSVMALGKDKVFVLIMPEKDSPKEHIKDAEEFTSKLGVNYKKINITPYLKKFGLVNSYFLNCFPMPQNLKNKITKKLYRFFEKKEGITPYEASLKSINSKNFTKYLRSSNAHYRIKHRIRMLLLYKYAELNNKIVLGAANKTEEKIGLFVKHGCDQAVDIMPIINLYKSQVKKLAEFINIPKNFIKKKPAPDIIPGITDEEAVGICYEELDNILYLLEMDSPIDDIIYLVNTDRKKIQIIQNLKEKSEHMRKIYRYEN